MTRNPAAAGAQCAPRPLQHFISLPSVHSICAKALSDHMFIIVFLQSGVWFHYDDSYVQPTKFPNVVRDCQQDGYLFFYVNSAILPLQAPKGA